MSQSYPQKDDRVVLLTGGTTGIGLALIKLLKDELFSCHPGENCLQDY
jgi:NADPH:quinone reductase-like Zn-dependent oxidoreductase